MKPRIAVDLDRTLGEVVLNEWTNDVAGFRFRPGCFELLERLRARYTLCLWTISSRWYLDAILRRGLAPYFEETYSSTEIHLEWKDIRRIDAEYLIDDSEWHRNWAEKDGLEVERYILVPAFESRADAEDPTLWMRLVEQVLLGPDTADGQGLTAAAGGE